MKEHVVPHKYIDKPVPIELVYSSQLSDGEINKYLERNGLKPKDSEKQQEIIEISKSDIHKLQNVTDSVNGKYLRNIIHMVYQWISSSSLHKNLFL